MEQKTTKLYPSTKLLENIEFKQRLKEKLNDVNSSNISNKNFTEMITYFKDKNNKSKQKYKNIKHYL